MHKKIILASSSPRRKELLKRLGIDFEVISPLVDEVPLKDESPTDFALRVSTEKPLSVAWNLESDCVVIGADTIVVVDEEIEEKRLMRRRRRKKKKSCYPCQTSITTTNR